MAFVTYTTVTVFGTYHRVASTHRTQSEATTFAAGRADETVYMGDVGNPVETGWYIDDTNGNVSPFLDLDTERTRIVRRDEAKRNLRLQLNTPGIVLWNINNEPRTLSFQRWIEANCRAASVDTNIDNNVTFAYIRSETRMAGRLWYWVHNRQLWYNTEADPNSGYYVNDDRNTWVWHQTTGTSTTVNSRSGVSRSAMDISDASVGATFNWAHWLVNED